MSRVAWLNDLRRGRRGKGRTPVYETLYQDGSAIRLSFWSASYLPVSPADGRPAVQRYSLADVTDATRSIAPVPYRPLIVAGWVEYAGGRWRDGEIGDVAINDGSPLCPPEGLPEKPTVEARAAFRARHGRPHPLVGGSGKVTKHRRPPECRDAPAERRA